MVHSGQVQWSMVEVGHWVDSFPWVLEEEEEVVLMDNLEGEGQVVLMDTQKQDKPHVLFEE